MPSYSAAPDDDPLLEVREEFAERLRRQPEIVLSRTRDSVMRMDNAARSAFQRWVENQIAVSDQAQKVRLDNLVTLLESDVDQLLNPRVLEQLSGLSDRATTSLPSLIGFGLLRVNSAFREIQYASIHSDLLADETASFIKESFSIGGERTQAAALKWHGTTGRAIQMGGLCVPNSFLERHGVVACEDLVGGNISILIACVPDSRNANVVCSVVFCFHPLANFFTEGDVLLRDYLQPTVLSRASSIRTFLLQRQAAAVSRRLSAIGPQMHSARGSDYERVLLHAVVPHETRNNPSGALVGFHFGDTTRVPREIVFCEEFFERHQIVGQLLWAEQAPLGWNKSDLRITADARQWAELRFIYRGGAPDQHLAGLPVLSKLMAIFGGECAEALSKALSGLKLKDLGDEALPPAFERVKIAAGLAFAMLDQVVQFLAQLVIVRGGTERFDRNFKQILDAWPYDNAQSLANLGQDLLKELRDLVPTAPAGTAAILGRIKQQPGATDETREFWKSSSRLRLGRDHASDLLAALFRADGSTATGAEWIRRLKTGCRLDRLRPLPFGQFQIYGYELPEPADPLIAMVEAYHGKVLAERERAALRNDGATANYARSQRNRLDGLLRVPHVLLRRSHGPAANVAGQLKREAVRSPHDELRPAAFRAAQILETVADEIGHVQDQTRLFFWALDGDLAERELAKIREDNPPVQLTYIVSRAVLRGLLLALAHKLTREEVASAFAHGKMHRPFMIDTLVEGISAILCTSRHLDPETSALWTFEQLESVLARHELWLKYDLSIPASVLLPADQALVVESVLTELAQNAAWVTIRSAALAKASQVIRMTATGARAVVTVTMENPTIPEQDLQALREFENLSSGQDVQGPSRNGLVRGLWHVREMSRLRGGSLISLTEPPYVSHDGVRIGVVIPVVGLDS